MSEYTLYIAAALLIAVSVFVLNPARVEISPSDNPDVASISQINDKNVDQTAGFAVKE